MDRRRLRKQRNIEKNNRDIEKAKDSGRFIKENHGISTYSADYTKNTSIDLRERLEKDPSLGNFRNLKSFVLNLLVFWSPEYKSEDKNYFKKLLENYWDGKY